MAGIGHNWSGNADSRAALRLLVERIDRLEDDKKAIADDIKDIYAEAKGNGYDVKALRAVVRMRRQDAEKRRELEAIVETYMHALGMLAYTPLGQAALARDLPPTRPLPPVDTSNPPFAVPPDEPPAAVAD